MIGNVMNMRVRTGGIQAELKQRKPFSGPAEATTAALLRTADVLRADLEMALAGMRMTPQQFNVLRILRGSHPAPIATLEIADRMIERAPGITRLLDRLEAAGYVRRERCKEDRRRVWCHITPEGLAALELAVPFVHETERKRAGRLSRAELTQLLALLERVREEVE